jgi:hypothetical protein
MGNADGIDVTIVPSNAAPNSDILRCSKGGLLRGDLQCGLQVYSILEHVFPYLGRVGSVLHPCLKHDLPGHSW